ncbi:hypothetical protein FB451DRAFT_1404134 [Mycena latifolia]|nr:hypothetical protein FB451DRAFT_1404134 [Mycena latifolia]
MDYGPKWDWVRTIRQTEPLMIKLMNTVAWRMRCSFARRAAHVGEARRLARSSACCERKAGSPYRMLRSRTCGVVDARTDDRAAVGAGEAMSFFLRGRGAGCWGGHGALSSGGVDLRPAQWRLMRRRTPYLRATCARSSSYTLYADSVWTVRSGMLGNAGSAFRRPMLSLLLAFDVTQTVTDWIFSQLDEREAGQEQLYRGGAFASFFLFNAHPPFISLPPSLFGFASLHADFVLFYFFLQTKFLGTYLYEVGAVAKVGR